MITWLPANPHIPITTTVTVKDGKEIRRDTFADGQVAITEIPLPKYVVIYEQEEHN
jgi:hypothetical protein